MRPTRILLTAVLLGACSQPAPASTQAPSFRATSGPNHVPQPIKTPPDRDGDRVYDYADQCPDQPGSLRDGCPYVDSDRDGISDKYDKCPNSPEPRPGQTGKDGCSLTPLPPPPPPIPPLVVPGADAPPPAATPG